MEYDEQLFEDTRQGQKIYEGMIGEQGPSISREEILHVINNSKNGKAPGPDKITNDILKLITTDHIGAFTQLINDIYNTGIIPKE